MKHEKLAQALDEVSQAHIGQAIQPKKKRGRLYLLGAIAAILALVLLTRPFHIPLAIRAQAVSTASDPRVTKRPSYNSDDFDDWIDEREARFATRDQALLQMEDFLDVSCETFLSGTQENALYSPINAYLGLAMLAEITGGEARAQVLALLGTDDLARLRTQISALWETVYHDEQNQTSLLANSLWLDKSIRCEQATADTLAYHHYASVYRANLNSASGHRAIGAWLNNNTGGLLKSVTDSYQLPDETLLVLFSTIYFQGRWNNEFNPGNNTSGLFHAPSGDREVTYMNAKLREMNYYWGEDFGAVQLGLKNGASMWFILPDEDKTVDDVLASGEYLDVVQHRITDREYSKYMKVNLSIPKFDITATADLQDGLKALGVTDVFDIGAAAFSEFTDEPVFLAAAKQTVRIMIDEEGVKAAAYFELPGAGAAMPPDEIIDFVLDRPFLFAVTSSSVPLFTGVVNEP